MEWSQVYIGLEARFHFLFIYLLSIQLVQCSPIVGPLSADPHHLIKSCLNRLLEEDDQPSPITGDGKLSRRRRSDIPQAQDLNRLLEGDDKSPITAGDRKLARNQRDIPHAQEDRKLFRRRRSDIPQAQEDQLERLFQDPLVNATSIDRYINSEHIYNLSSAEMSFYQQSTDEFHRRLFHRLSRWHKKMLNESMIQVQDNLEAYSRKHNLKCDTQFDVPARDGMEIVYNGLRHFRSEMISWIKHTLVDKPKAMVRQQKLLLEVFMDNNTMAIPRQKIRDFWRFEQCFANMLRYYEHELTERVFQHYDKLLLHYISHTGNSNNGRFQFPRSLPNLSDHLVMNEHMFTMDLRNDTTTEYADITPLFTLNEEQKKEWAIQRRDHSGDYRDSVDEPRPWI